MNIKASLRCIKHLRNAKKMKAKTGKSIPKCFYLLK